MQKNENYINSFNETNKSKESSFYNQINFLTQLEKDIYILINYIRTNPLDFSNNLIKKNKNKILTDEQIEIIKYLEEKYSKERLLPFHEIPEISEAAKNLLYTISQNDSIYVHKNLQKLKPSSLNLRTRLSNYGLRTGRIFENVIFEIENPEDIVYHILKDENGRNMLLSNKMKFIGIGCCFLPSNKICSVIDIVQDFIPYKKSQKNNIKYNNYINNNISKENNYSPKMNIIINNTNNNNEYIPNIIKKKHLNQRKKNMVYENGNNNKENIYKSHEYSSTELNEQKSYKSYNIIINNNNKIIPIRNNLNNINELKEDNKNKNNTNSSKVGLCKSKSVYGFNFGQNKLGFKFNNVNRGNSINRYQKLNSKEKLEILHKINQRKNNYSNYSLSKNNSNSNLKNLIPLSPDYSKKNISKFNLDNKFISPVSPYSTKKIYTNNESDINNIDSDNFSNLNKDNYYEFSETMPNYQNQIDKEIKIDDLILLKNQIKEELKIEVKNELKNEMKEYKENENKNNANNVNKNNMIYHKRYKSDSFHKSKNVINRENNNKNKEKNVKRTYQSFDNNKSKIKNLYIKDEHRLKNKNEIKKLIRLYNKEKDIKRFMNNINEVSDIINDENNNNKEKNNQSISKFFFGFKSKNSNENKNNNDKHNLFLIKYQKTKTKDQTFKLIKNKSQIKNISKLCLKQDIENNIINNNNNINNQLLINSLYEYNNNSTKKSIFRINSYRNKNNSYKKMKELSIEMYLNDDNFYKENKKYKTPEKCLNKIIKDENIILNSEDKKYIKFEYKTSSYFRKK